MREILVEQMQRVLTDHGGPAVLRANEAGVWPAALWAEVEALGLPTALAPEAIGGAGLGWDDAVALWRVLGAFGAPVPLAACMAANGLLGAAGLEPPAGYVALTLPDAPGIAWGRAASHVVSAGSEGLALHGAAAWRQGRDPLSREPLDAGPLPRALAVGDLPSSLGTGASLLASALLHAAQIAGAVEAILAMGVDYAQTRVQFGRPIGGFQAVQHLLAQAAGEVAAAGVAADNAGRAVARRGLAEAAFEIACAKLVCGEAAGRVAATIHQVFAAMGFTDDHPLHLHTRRLWAWRDAAGAERVWAQRLGRAALARGGAALWPDLTAREESDA
jgi:acyl-CoA dehydrogenase